MFSFDYKTNTYIYSQKFKKNKQKKCDKYCIKNMKITFIYLNIYTFYSNLGFLFGNVAKFCIERFEIKVKNQK